MTEHDLNFSNSSTYEAGSYRLIELTPELTSLIDTAVNNEEELRFTIKGQPNEDAVLCTADKTYGMRSVGLSNTLLVVTAVPDVNASAFSDNAVMIRDQLKEIVELAAAVPKLHKLSALLRDQQYDEGQEDELEDDHVVCVPLYVMLFCKAYSLPQERYTYQDARKDIQASDAELDMGLKARRILIINNELRPIAPSYLTRLLELLLNLLVSLSMQHTSASVESLSSAFVEHEVPRAVSTQIMVWFGEIKDGKWQMDVKAVVKEIGLGILRDHRHDPIEKEDLLAKWKSLVGDTFESAVSLALLEGNYLESEVLGSESTTYKYFPASDLPVEPAARFSDLFLTRSKWKGDEIAPFLSDIAVNVKERDKLLLKYCRTVTEPQGVRYTARAQYNG
ncbi:sister chromatid cohesion protein Dcc1 [Crassisporium funariophilum]|nr:sister chromatid cohesion protein Dcc1 [Crassisporium funariophilum]